MEYFPTGAKNAQEYFPAGAKNAAIHIHYNIGLKDHLTINGTHHGLMDRSGYSHDRVQNAITVLTTSGLNRINYYDACLGWLRNKL